MTTTTKLNLEVSVSKSYQKVTLSLSDCTFTYENDEELKTEIRRLYTLIQAEAERELRSVIAGGSQ